MFPGFLSGSGRRRLSIFGVALLTGVLCLGGPRPAAAEPGDLNGDTVVDMEDVVLALEIAGGLTESDFFHIADGDVAGGPENSPDGELSLLDAVRIARAVNGLDDLGGGGPGDPPAVLPKMDSVTFAANFSKSYKLDPAFHVTGTVTDTQGQPITNAALVGDIFRSTTGTISFEHATNVYASGDDTPIFGETDFEILTAQGLNNVTIHTQVSDVNSINGATTNYTVVQNAVPATLNVTGNMTGVAFVRPDLPAPGTLTGMVTGTNFTPTTVFYSSDAGSFEIATLTGSTYSLHSGPGTGSLLVYGNLTGDTNVSVQTYQYGNPVTVSAGVTTTRNVTIPTLATLTGTVTAPAGLKATSASISNFQTGQNVYISSNSLSDTDQEFKLAVPPGTYSLSVSLPQRQFGGSSLSLSHAVQVTLNAGANTRNVTLPAIPANVTFTGTVTGTGNEPLSDISVSAFGTVANNYTASAYTETGANGAFTLTLPPGTYTVYLSP